MLENRFDSGVWDFKTMRGKTLGHSGRLEAVQKHGGSKWRLEIGGRYRNETSCGCRNVRVHSQRPNGGFGSVGRQLNKPQNICSHPSALALCRRLSPRNPQSRRTGPFSNPEQVVIWRTDWHFFGCILSDVKKVLGCLVMKRQIPTQPRSLEIEGKRRHIRTANFFQSKDQGEKTYTHTWATLLSVW